MIPRRCLPTVAQINRDTVLKSRIRLYFGLRRGTLSYTLREKGLGHADLVLCLLRLNSPASIHFAELLVGKPIVYGPSFRLSWPSNGKPSVFADRTPRVVYVVDENPRLNKTKAKARFDHFRVGRTLAQLIARGVTRRDIRKAERRGWVKFQEIAA